ncbi:MAG: 50S ribosomal protein L29 [Pseudobdellovibrio sp.]
MIFKELENKSATELIKQKTELLSKIFDMKMKNSLGQLSGPHQIRILRRDVARINTVIIRKSVR